MPSIDMPDPASWPPTWRLARLPELEATKGTFLQTNTALANPPSPRGVVQVAIEHYDRRAAIWQPSQKPPVPGADQDGVQPLIARRHRNIPQQHHVRRDALKYAVEPFGDAVEALVL